MKQSDQPSQQLANPAYLASHQLVNHQEQLQVFWANRMLEIRRTTNFKNHCLPLARIRKIMKADQDINMISVEAPVVFAKACEFFILELTLKSWMNAKEDKRKTLLKKDITVVLNRTETYDFLVNLVSEDELKDESSEGVASAALTGIGTPADQMAGAGMMIGPPADQMASYAVPPPQSAVQMAGAGMMIGNPAHQMASYAVPPPQSASYLLPQPQAQQQAAQHHQQVSDGYQSNIFGDVQRSLQ